MVRIQPALAALLVIAACQQPADETAAITQVRNTWVTAWKTGNGAQLAGLYDENATNMLNNASTMQGRIAIASGYGGQFAQFTPNDIVITSDRVEVSGDLAYDYGTFQVSVTPKDGAAPMSDSGRYLVVLKRQADGSWKIAAAMDNSVTRLPESQAEPAPSSTTPQ